MFRRLIPTLFFLSASVCLANADPTQWVSGELRITMRAGPGDDFDILRVLPTGTALTIAAQNGEWAEVELSDGARGWVVARYLEKDRPAQLELPHVQQALARAESRIRELETQLTNYEIERAELDALRARTKELETANIELRTTDSATMMTIGAAIALVGLAIGLIWPRRPGHRGIAIPSRYLRS